MLFNSYTFIFLFLPLTLLVYSLLSYKNYYETSLLWLVITSLFFYGWWNPPYVILIIGSILFNYFLGIQLTKRVSHKKIILISGISANLLLLGYFKYTNFLISTINMSEHISISTYEIILPLAISFFTFQQIAYLVDTYYGKTKEYSFLHYCLFVTFFPQLIAGPIVHHKEMLPQFMSRKSDSLNYGNLSVGLAIFSIGLFKKVIIADNLAIFSTPVFNAAETDVAITFFEAWGAALSYTLQLYFDFSGYSDMAVGLARLFGIRLPINFYSPYKAVNITEFWRRWHITLSRFLRDYVYIPLGGNRRGSFNRYRNLLITMLLGGIWHGAGWTFVFWGVLHGVYLCIHNLWRKISTFIPFQANKTFSTILSHQLTFLSVIVAWVFFRAESFNSAQNILNGMFGQHGAILSERYSFLLPAMSLLMKTSIADNDFVSRHIDGDAVIWIFIVILIAWFTPNTYQIFRNQRPTCNQEFIRADKRINFHSNTLWAITISLILTISFLNMSSISEFLYFQF
jgi:D-alanyl-lipoteichoic acid acyltransferase DltB (MBOAT superfamily)